MANTVIALKKSATIGSSPGSLANGELAINYADGVIYYKAANGTIASISSGTPSFGTISANGTLLIADQVNDYLTINPGDNITIVGDAINDKLTINANLTAANSWANTVGTAGNNYTNGVGTAGNNYTISVGVASNAWANAVGTAGNNYTISVGVAGNNYSLSLVTAANNWANTKLSNTSDVWFAGNLNFPGSIYLRNDITHVNSIFFATNSLTSANASVVAGQLTWNSDDKTIDLGTGESIQQIGLEQYVRILNQSGETIYNSNAVAYYGTVGASGKLLGRRAIANNSYDSKQILGIATSDIVNGAEGFVTTFGKVRKIDTSMFNEGDIIYVSPSIRGGLQNTKPSAPNNKVQIGTVITKSSVNGTIFAAVQRGSSLADDELVFFNGSIAEGDLIRYVGANGRFQNFNENSIGPAINAVAAFAKANAANVLAFNTGIGANAWANAVGTAGNNYTNAVGVAGNNYTVSVGAASNTWANTVGTAGNNYTNAVGAAGNNYTNSVGAAANSASDIRDTAGNNYTNSVGAASNTWANTVGTAGNNYTVSVGASSNAWSNAVGTAGNNYTNSVGAATNSASVIRDTAGNNYTISVGASSNAWTNAVATAGNNYTNSVGAAGNNYSSATYVKLIAAQQTITGDLAITGNLTFLGNSVSISSNNLIVGDSLIYLAANNYTGTDILDIGFVANYGNTTGANVHTGLIRDATTKQYYLFQSYDAELQGNNTAFIAYANNMVNAALNADFITSNLTLGGANAITTIVNNAAGANGWANAVGTAGNNYTNSVGVAGNNYTNAVGTAGNNYTISVGASANAWANTLYISSLQNANNDANAANSFAVTIGAASNSWANAVGTAGNNYTISVGAAGNNYTITVGASANAWANTLYISSLQNANNDANAANAWANTLAVSSNNYAGFMANSANIYAGQMVNAANAWANTKGGGGTSVNVGLTAPTGNTQGSLWFNTDYGRLLIWYTDTDSSQWVDTGAGGNQPIIFDEFAYGNTNTDYFLTGASNAYGTLSTAYISTGKLKFNPNTGIINVSGGLVTSGNINATGTITATVFNSLSDINKKTNVQIIDHAIDKVSQLDGVTFNWKDNGQPSAGLIAQQLKEVMPELVGEDMTVNYSGVIGLLIECIKELNTRIPK